MESHAPGASEAGSSTKLELRAGGLRVGGGGGRGGEESEGRKTTSGLGEEEEGSNTANSNSRSSNLSSPSRPLSSSPSSPPRPFPTVDGPPCDILCSTTREEVPLDWRSKVEAGAGARREEEEEWEGLLRRREFLARLNLVVLKDLTREKEKERDWVRKLVEVEMERRCIWGLKGRVRCWLVVVEGRGGVEGGKSFRPSSRVISLCFLSKLSLLSNGEREEGGGGREHDLSTSAATTTTGSSSVFCCCCSLTLISSCEGVLILPLLPLRSERVNSPDERTEARPAS